MLDIKKLAETLSADHGAYLHDISSFASGTVSITKSKTVKLTIELPIEQLGGGEDVRCVLAPHCHKNRLVPMLIFIDSKFEVPA